MFQMSTQKQTNLCYFVTFSHINDFWFLKKLFIQLFLAALGLHCCRLISICGEQGLFCSCCAKASLCSGISHGAQTLGPEGFRSHSTWAKQLWHTGSTGVVRGLRCSTACGTLPDQGLNSSLLLQQAGSTKPPGKPYKHFLKGRTTQIR